MNDGRSTNDAHSMVLTFPARPEYVALARLAWAGLARVTPVDPEIVADIKLALSEAVNNAVVHAYPDAVGSVRVTYELAGRRLSITVEDEGRGFDRVELPGHAPNLREDHMGMTIVAAVVDDVTVERRTDGPGMRLSFSKTLDSGVR